MEPLNQEENQVCDARNLESIDYKDPNLWNKLIQSNDPKDKQLLNSIAMKIIKARDNDLFALLLSHNYKIDVLNEKGQTALHCAFYARDLSIVKEILSWAPFKNSSSDYADSNGLTHLHIACAVQLPDGLEMIERYLKQGSNINACYHTDPDERNSQFTPLHFAMKYCAFKIVKILLGNGANVSAVDSKGRTPLHLAFEQILFKQFLQTVELLITSFHSDIEAKDNRGDTPLLSTFDHYDDMELSFNISEAKIKFDVLLKNGADIGAKNNNGDTVLHLVIKTLRLSHCHFYMPHMSFDDSKHAELVKEILKNNDKLLEAKNNEGKTPLQLAVSMASADVVKVLLDHNANIRLIKIDCGDEKIFCYPEIVPNFEILQNIMAIVRSIVDHGFEFSQKDYLIVSKFLVHEVTSCNCSCDDFDDNVLVKVYIMLEYGTATHSIQVLSKMIDNNTIDSKDILDYLQTYLHVMKKSSFYLDKGVEEILIALPYQNNNVVLNDKAEKELAYLKSDIKLKNGIRLYDLMLKHPYTGSQFFTNDNFDCKVIDDFVQYKTIIEGFITKVIVRNYILQMAQVFLPLTILSLLPDLCNEAILSFLSNVDIYQFCSAVFIPELKNLVIN